MDAWRSHHVKLGRESLDCVGDPKMLEMLEPWDTCPGELLTERGPSQKRDMCHVPQSTKLGGDRKSLIMEFGVCPAGFLPALVQCYIPYALLIPFCNGNEHSEPLSVGSV